MDITREMLLERRKQMEDEKQQCVNQANALHGAIIDIDYWVTVLERAETPGREEANAATNSGLDSGSGGATP